MTDLGLASLMAGQAIILALINRLRWRCQPNEEGRCVFSSGCSEVPLQDSHDQIDAHEYVIGDGQKVLLVSSKT